MIYWSGWVIEQLRKRYVTLGYICGTQRKIFKNRKKIELLMMDKDSLIY